MKFAFNSGINLILFIYFVTLSPSLFGNATLIIDDCANAETIVVQKDGPYFMYSYDGTTHTNDVCDENASNDIWLKFTAPTQRIILDQEIISNSTFTLFEGECSNLTFLDCYTNVLRPSFSSLVVGDVYYLKVSSNGDEDVKFMLHSVPDNDSFESAFDLKPDTCFTEYTIFNELYYEFTPTSDVYEFSVYYFGNNELQHEEIRFYDENFEFLGRFDAPFREIIPNPNLSAFWADIKIRFESGNTYYVM